MPVKTTPRSRLVSIGAWTLGRTLGRGAYAHVRLATHKNGHQAACKILPALHRPRQRPLTDDELVDAVEAYKEVVLLKGLAGSGLRGIVTLEGIMEEHGWTYIFLELNPYSLSSIPTPWPLEQLIPFYRTLLHTVHDLHRLDVCHEDIKRSNILVSAKGHPVLVDFGFSHLALSEEHVKSAGGTLDYSSPEKIASQYAASQVRGSATDAEQSYNPRASDVWALGIVLTKMLGIPHPFLTHSDNETTESAQRRIVECEPEFQVQLLESGSVDHLFSFLYKILDKQPSRRPTIPQLLSEPFLDTSREDPRPCRIPPYQFPTRSNRRFDPSTIADLCFLSYLRREFALCQTSVDLEQRLYGNEPCWLKRWAVMLSQWRKRAEMDWEDIPSKVPDARSSPMPSQHTSKRQALREIHLTPNVQKTKTLDTPVSPLARLKSKAALAKKNAKVADTTARGIQSKFRTPPRLDRAKTSGRQQSLRPATQDSALLFIPPPKGMDEEPVSTSRNDDAPKYPHYMTAGAPSEALSVDGSIASEKTPAWSPIRASPRKVKRRVVQKPGIKADGSPPDAPKKTRNAEQQGQENRNLQVPQARPNRRSPRLNPR